MFYYLDVLDHEVPAPWTRPVKPFKVNQPKHLKFSWTTWRLRSSQMLSGVKRFPGLHYLWFLWIFRKISFFLAGFGGVDGRFLAAMHRKSVSNVTVNSIIFYPKAFSCCRVGKRSNAINNVLTFLYKQSRNKETD